MYLNVRINLLYLKTCNFINLFCAIRLTIVLHKYFKNLFIFEWINLLSNKSLSKCSLVILLIV